MVAYQPILLFQSDAYVYLNRSLDLTPSHFRPLLYSFFLKPFVFLHDLRVVAGMQHLMGMGIGILAYSLVWRRTRSRVAALFAAAFPLLDGYVLAVEHYVLAETLFTLLSLGGLALVMWKREVTPVIAAMAGACLGLAALTRYVGLVLIVVAMLPILASHSGSRARSLLALLVGAAVPLALYASWFQAANGTFAITDRGGYFLYGRVASFADCEGLSLPDHERMLCDLPPRSQRENPNYYVFRASSPANQLDPPPGLTVDGTLRDFSYRVIRDQPFLYLKETGADLIHYLAPGRWTGRQDNRLNIIRFPVTIDDPRPFAALVERRGGSPPPAWDERRFRIVRPLAASLRTYQAIIYLHGPILALMLMGVGIGLIRSPGWAERLWLLAPALAGIGLIVVPVMTVTFDYRFLLPAIPFFSVASGAAYRLVRSSPPRDGAPERPDLEVG